MNNSREIPDCNVPHLIKSGISGWAQMNGWRGDTSIRNRVDYDICTTIFYRFLLKAVFGKKFASSPIPSEVEEYDLWQRRGLSMKPGMTCLWQATPDRNGVTFDKWMRMDLEHIGNWSSGLDFKILWKTMKVVLTAEGR